MNSIMTRVSLTYAAGSVGALVYCWLTWYLAQKGVPQRFGIAVTPAWSAAFLYSHLVWGGLWGFLFVLPMWRTGFWIGVFSRGILFSLFPTLFQLFYGLPYLAGKGMMGLALGKLTPVFVFLTNAVWGVSTALWLYFTRARL